MKKFISSHILQLFISAVMIIDFLFHLFGFYDRVSKYLLRYSLELSILSLSTIFLSIMFVIALLIALFAARKKKEKSNGMHISSQASPSRPVPLAQAADGLAAKTSVKAGKNSSYSEYCPCPANLLQFWMRMAIPSSATATMRGVRRCGALVNWRRRWARCSRLGIAGMCLMRRRGCTICGVGIIR